MITQIEIDGFKTFKDFKVELAPFQVIVGPNGSGKSNLFDALHLLSRLAYTDLASAFQEVRGDASELFTLLPDGKHSDRIRITVEMLVDRKVQDSGGGEVELIDESVALKRDATVKYRRLRYELEVILGTDTYGLDRFYISNESLKSIPSEKDRWSRNYKPFSQDGELPDLEERVFIATELTHIAVVNSRTDSTPQDVNAPMILQYPDEQGRLKRFYADEVQRTVLSRVSEIDYPHAFAAREELRSFGLLRLNPEVLGQPSSLNAPTSLSFEGGNLASTLARMQAEDKFALTDVSRDMANLVPGLLKIRVERDKFSEKYVVQARTQDERTFSSRVISDGTLRLLALATMRNDPHFHGVLCLEEPENGVNPLSFKKLARLLREMATDFSDPRQMEEPLRQVIIATHSPAFISQPDVIDSLLLAITPTRVGGKNKPSLRVTRMIPVRTSKFQSTSESGDIAVEAATIDTVRQYLESEALDGALDYLQQARTNLSNRGR